MFQAHSQNSRRFDFSYFATEDSRRLGPLRDTRAEHRLMQSKPIQLGQCDDRDGRAESPSRPGPPLGGLCFRSLFPVDRRSQLIWGRCSIHGRDGLECKYGSSLRVLSPELGLLDRERLTGSCRVTAPCHSSHLCTTSSRRGAPAVRSSFPHTANTFPLSHRSWRTRTMSKVWQTGKRFLANSKRELISRTLGDDYPGTGLVVSD